MSDTKKSDPLIEAIVAETQASIRQREDAAEQAKVYQLAFWPDDERAMPGDFIACALFTASKSTQYVTRCALASINGLTVIFTGKRLTQVHADVWMGIIHLARERYQGDVVRFRARELLELIGRHTHQGQRKQLEIWISQLNATEVLIQDDAQRKRYDHKLLPARTEDDADGHTVYAIDISRDLARILSGRFWKVDWSLRKRLQNKPLALWLQTFFARFTRPVSVVQLHELTGSSASMKKFRQNLGHALDELHAEGGYSAAINRETDTVEHAKRPPPKPRKPKHEGQAELFPPLRLVK